MSDILYADPFLKSPDRTRGIPNGANLICAYGVWIEIDWVTEVALLRRRDDVDELWLVLGPYKKLFEDICAGLPSENGHRNDDCLQSGLAYVVPRIGDEIAACRSLLRSLFRDRIHYMQPLQLETPGILDEATFISLTSDLKDEIKAVSEITKKAESEIVKVAHQLQLNPQPSGTDADGWLARCPETNHHLHISASGESFWCGWCKRKGGSEELRAFKKERQVSTGKSGDKSVS